MSPPSFQLLLPMPCRPPGLLFFTQTSPSSLRKSLCSSFPIHPETKVFSLSSCCPGPFLCLNRSEHLRTKSLLHVFSQIPSSRWAHWLKMGPRPQAALSFDGTYLLLRGTVILHCAFHCAYCTFSGTTQCTLHQKRGFNFLVPRFITSGTKQTFNKIR